MAYFQELYMAQLTSPTTCYSGVRSQKGDVSHSFATETHILRMCNEDDENDIAKNCSDGYYNDHNSNHLWKDTDLIFPDSEDVVEQRGICVGCCPSEDGEFLALVLINQPSLGSPSDGMDATATTTSSVAATATEDSSIHRDNPLDFNNEVSTPRKVEATLVLRQSRKSMGESGDKWKNYMIDLDFRPLAPCLSCLHDSSRSLVRIWLGSADDSLLRLYQLVDGETLQEVSLSSSCSHTASTTTPTSLNPTEPTLPFSFTSPIMSLDSKILAIPEAAPDVDQEGGTEENSGATSKGGTTIWEYVAVACQDGTIRLIRWQPSLIDTNTNGVQSSTVIVDGPIVCLHMLVAPQKGSAVLVVGSLCGYVCQLEFDLDPFELKTDPAMVAEGLWNISLQAEDSVLAIEAWEEDGQHRDAATKLIGRFVVIGTHSGQCRLYHLGTKHGSDNSERRLYHLLAECQLPHSIHGICRWGSSSKHVDLLVSTRRSLHLLGWKSNYCADLARRRLKLLTAKRKISEL